jgi:tRNA threonylcarbamoyladenosine biosynthesis protein TsaB
MLLFPMLDARRMEVYTAGFDPSGNCIRETSADIIDETSFGDLLNHHKICFFGDGAEKCRPLLYNNPNAIFFTGFTNSAQHLSGLACSKFERKEFEDVAYFEPYYLKDFIAGKKKA